jgi:hypothetical protein
VDSLIDSRRRGQAMLGNSTEAEAERVMRDHMAVPRHYYPISSVLAADDGGLWLQREADGTPVARWTVLDASGTPRGEVRLPRSTALRVVSGAEVWAIVRDEFDVPYLVRYRLRTD